MKRIDDIKRRFSQKDQTIQTLSEAIAEKDSLIRTLTETIEEKDHSIRSLSDELTQKNDAINVIATERDELKGYLADLQPYKTLFPPGHFYSPIPSMEEVREREDILFDRSQDALLGIDLNEEEQLSMLDLFAKHYAGLPFTDEKNENWRYYFNNPFFGYSDGIALFCFLKEYQPKRVIEVGSGFSSALMLDVDEHFFDSKTAFTFIEPYPERLKSLLTSHDHDVRIIEDKLQNVDLDIFSSLKAGDILLIDSTHVSKIGSDVNLYLSEILPRLAKGVLIHIHDIIYPFEYPKEWIYDGRAWNEAYLVRAFLQFNTSFKIKYWCSYFEYTNRDLYFQKLPLCQKGAGGSLWLEKTV